MPHIEKVLKEHYSTVSELGYGVVGVFLHGSQNYGLETEYSDIDSRAIVLPSFSDFIQMKPATSRVIEVESGLVDIKDLRLMVNCFKKQNVNFLEILFTRYYVLSPKYVAQWSQLTNCAEQVARYNPCAAVKAMVGMAKEKFERLSKPTPATKEVIEKYGYNPKELHHLLRLLELVQRYSQGAPFEECLWSEKKDFLLRVKKGFLDKPSAEFLARDSYKEIQRVAEYFLSLNKEIGSNPSIPTLLNDILFSIFSSWVRSESFNENY